MGVRHDETGALERIGACAVPAALSGGSQSPGTRRQHADYYSGHPADLAGLAVGQDPKTVEGEDLSRLIRSGGEATARRAYMEIAPFGPLRVPARISRHSHEPLHSVRGLDGPWLLFDDEKDPYQMDNLAGKEEGRGLQKDLDGRLRAEAEKNR